MRFYGKVVRCDNTECGLPVFRLKAGRTLSDDEIKDLLTEGHTKLLKGFKSKQGKSFDAVVAFDGEYNTTLCSRRLKGQEIFRTEEIVLTLPLVQSNELFFDTGLHSYFGFSGGTRRDTECLFLPFFQPIIPLNINPLNPK